MGLSLAVQWLRCPLVIARGAGLIPAWGTEILQAARYSQKKKKNYTKKKGNSETEMPGSLSRASGLLRCEGREVLT